ncbi:flagellar export chaperone FliS [Deltaproteobacteria bacterium TL4]
MNTYGQYQQAYKKASITTLDQTKLIVMLYDGAIRNISIALEKMKERDVEKTHIGFVKSKNIISELMLSLNEEKGGDIAKNLKSLYNYMFGLLIDANVNKDPEPALITLKLLKDLRDAWSAISITNNQTTPQRLQTGTPNNGNSVRSINLKG